MTNFTQEELQAMTKEELETMVYQMQLCRKDDLCDILVESIENTVMDTEYNTSYEEHHKYNQQIISQLIAKGDDIKIQTTNCDGTVFNLSMVQALEHLMSNEQGKANIIALHAHRAALHLANNNWSLAEKFYQLDYPSDAVFGRLKGFKFE